MGIYVIHKAILEEKGKGTWKIYITRAASAMARKTRASATPNRTAETAE